MDVFLVRRFDVGVVAMNDAKLVAIIDEHGLTHLAANLSHRKLWRYCIYSGAGSEDIVDAGDAPITCLWCVAWRPWT